MARLLVLMITIGLADSINPTTIAPALYLASCQHPRVRVAEFTLGVFVVYLAGGAVIAVGGGQLVTHIVGDVDIRQTVRYTGEVVAGVLLVVAATLVWLRRGRLAARGLPEPKVGRRSSALLGASITAVELPTAFPYFAAIAAIVGSGLSAGQQFVLLLVFNICFVLPLIGILVTLMVTGDRAEILLMRARNYLEHRWPHVLAGLILLVGAIALLFGATGLAGGIHGRVGGFFRGLHRALHHVANP